MHVFFLILSLFSNEVRSYDWKDNLTFFPIIAYTPETSALLGAGATYTFNIANENDINKSYTNVLLMLSFNSQSLFINTSEIKLKNNYLLRTKLLYINFPDYFYGYGNNTLKEEEVKYTLNQFITGAGFFKTIYDKFSFGFEFEYLYNAEISDLNVYGSKSLNLFGIGPSIIYDTRDSLFFPSSGSYHQIFLLWYNNDKFSELSIDLRKYFNILKDDVLAIQLYNLAYNREVPFFKQAKLGDRNTLRGIYVGRYRDYNLLSMQAEYRKKISKKFGLVIFSGFGKVADNYNDLFNSTYKYAYGTGLRYALNNKEKINLRLDFANSKDGLQFYFSYMEAF